MEELKLIRDNYWATKDGRIYSTKRNRYLKQRVGSRGYMMVNLSIDGKCKTFTVLGFCIYCSTTWITFFLCALWLFNWESLPDWNLIVIGVLAATGVQHLIVTCACRFLIYKHPDLDENNI